MRPWRSRSTDLSPEGHGQGLGQFGEMAGDGSEPGYVVYGGDRVQQRRAGCALPWREVESLVKAND